MKHKILDRRGWDNDKWSSLSPDEREELLAVYYQREKTREDLLRQMFSEEKVYAESITARTMIELLRILS